MTASALSSGRAPQAAAGSEAVPALEAHGLRARLGRTEVLRAIDVTLSPGRWTAVVGPNGAGKSTLLKALAGLLPCDGEVRLHGRQRFHFLCDHPEAAPRFTRSCRLDGGVQRQQPRLPGDRLRAIGMGRHLGAEQ